MERRRVLKAGMALIATATAASIFRPIGRAASVLIGGSPWLSREPTLPQPAVTDRLLYLTQPEADLVSAIFDRFIPADDVSVSASQAGCVTFIDNQLAGAYGAGDWMYKAGPIAPGTPEQGNQSLPLTPAEIYRTGLKEMAAHCQQTKGKTFLQLPHGDQDVYLEAMEAGSISFPSIDAKRLFGQLHSNAMEGFFADPIYGGNRDMVGWKMIGFPGARYDYRDYVEMKGQRLDIAPISLVGAI